MILNDAAIIGLIDGVGDLKSDMGRCSGKLDDVLKSIDRIYDTTSKFETRISGLESYKKSIIAVGSVVVFLTTCAIGISTLL